jgi:hypothetical protein
MDPEYVKLVKNNQHVAAILPPAPDYTAEEARIEQKIKRELAIYRLRTFAAATVLNSPLELELGTRFDEQIAYVLSTALTNYENERVCGQTFANEEFQSAIRSLVPEAHVFKAFPIQFKSHDTEEMLRAMKSTPVTPTAT